MPTQPPSEFAVAWLSAEAFGAGAWPSGADEPTEPLTPEDVVGWGGQARVVGGLRIGVDYDAVSA